MSPPANRVNAREATADPQWLELVRQQVASLRYSVVHILVHDARVTPIDKTERVRFDKPRKDTH